MSQIQDALPSTYRYTQIEMRQLAAGISAKFSSLREGEQLFDVPYRHCVIDDFLPAELARQCVHAFPNSTDGSWISSNDADIEVKSRSNWTSEFDAPEGVVDRRVSR